MYKKISAVVVPTLIAVGIIAYMLYRVWGDLLEALQHMIPTYLVIGIVICLFAWWLRGWRYHYILASLTYNVPVIVATACIFVSQTVNLVVPARLGDFVRIFILKHDYNTSYSEGISSIVVERVFDIVTVALLGGVALLFIPNVPSWFYTVIFVPLLIGIAFFVFLVFSGKLTTQNKYIRIILTMLEEIRRASLTLKSIVVLSVSSIVIWLLDVLVCLSVVMMFQQQIPFAVVLLAIVIGNLVKAVPLTPGGVGTYELSLAFTFELYGVAPAIAFLIAVIDHLIKNIVTLVGGVISIYFLGDWVIPTIRQAIHERSKRGKES
ncbi:MAG: lysylphosphatidylglycerol synthase transmembrane domain-containing protein [Methanoregula sp.]